MGLSQNRCEVLVIGGGPAGLAAAIAMRQRGIDVLLADALIPPIDKACGEGIMPDSRRTLALFGVNLNSTHGAFFRGITFCDDRSTATANFSSGEGIGLRRVVLHSLLVNRAREVGVRMRWGAPVTLTAGQSPVLAGKRVTYRYLIGADGQTSRVRTWAGLNRGTLHTRRFGFRTHYLVTPWNSNVEVHWGPYGQAYVTPVADDEICISIVTRFPWLARTAQVIDCIPVLREKLRCAQITSRERGSITTTRTLHRVVRGNVALLGDASGSADAITGEGLAMAFRQSILLAESIKSASLTPYAEGHSSTLRIPQSMARSLLLMDRLPAARRKVLRVFAREPLLFEKLLRVHMGEESLHRFLLEQASRFGFRMLLPSPV